MRRIIAVMDKRRGIAKNGRIPWHLPGDLKDFKAKTSSGSKRVLMTGKTLRDIGHPLPGRENIVWTRDGELINRRDITPITDLKKFLNSNNDVWIIGGTALFNETLDLADELYITRIDSDFNCDSFFPKFENKFTLAEKSQNLTENNLTFHFEKWLRKSQE